MQVWGSVRSWKSTGRSLAFLPRSKHLLISWLQLPSAVILEPLKIKSVNVSIVSPSICREMMGPDAMIVVFIKRLFSSSLLSAIRMVSSAYLRLLIFFPVILIPEEGTELDKYIG